MNLNLKKQVIIGSAASKSRVKTSIILYTWLKSRGFVSPIFAENIC